MTKRTKRTNHENLRRRTSGGHRVGVGVATLLAACAVHPHTAWALQPVEVFLDHARTWSPQNRGAHATTAQRDAEVEISTGRLLPAFTATGTYTRNQYEVDTGSLLGSGGSSLMVGGQTIQIQIPNTVIQPQNQVDATLVLSVPIINVSSWDRREAAKATLEGAQADEADASQTVQKNVLRGYYSLLGEEAVVLSATKNLEIARDNVQRARDRKEGGTGSELDVQRAIADQAKAEQSLIGAQLNVTNRRRDLFSLTGLNAEPASLFPEDDLHDEAALSQWMGQTNDLPSVRSAVANTASTNDSARAIKSLVLPTISGTAEEKFTNATAFIGGHNAVYLLQLTAQWQLDTTIFAEYRAQNAAVAAAHAHEDQVRQNAEDAVFKDWQEIRSEIEAARSARAQVTATKLAAQLAEERYENGVATQLDVLQAQQDAFAADVARIQADANLAYARLALRLDSGKLVRKTR
jgi:outer membrane protein TolC